MRFVRFACGSLLAMSASIALAQAQPAAPAAPAPKYSTNTTTLGTLMADPAAKAVLTKHLPEMLNRETPGGGGIQDQASGMTLKEIQEATRAYSGDALSDKRLAEIDQDLAKLPAK